MKFLNTLVCIGLICISSCGQSSDDQISDTDDQISDTKVTSTIPGADISLEWSERDFGVIWDFESVTTTFPFTNTGSKTLVLKRLQAGCGCTSPVADKYTLQPGESGTITVTFDPSSKENKQDKKVTIFSNSAREPEKAFWIRSFVRPFVKINDKFLKLNEMELGKSHSVEFDFFPVDPDFTITSMEGSGKHGMHISGEEIEVPEGSPRRIRITVDDKMPWGAFHSSLLVSGYGKKPDGTTINHNFTVYANGKSFGKIKTDNYIIGLGTLQQGGSYHKRARIYHEDDVPFEVINTVILKPSVQGINATSVQNDDGSYNIIITGTLPPSHKGPFNAELLVQTDVSGEEILKFRITGVVPKK
ncbi:MAG: DUF1573 domain-containing protein [Phycisphaerales bacterium]|jgi:hypothetical protein|nr:DUF1573 domain-containing protein [Phycisphaerales bacterium]